MNAGNLDAKIVKALKKQEEKREKRVTRKKEVCFLTISCVLPFELKFLFSMKFD